MIRTPSDLRDAGLAVAPDALEAVAARYAIAITPTVRARIEHAADPVGLQFVPDTAELDHQPHELADPIGDEAHSPVPGLVHRYPDRVLLKPVLVCPVYCRFCFRREHVGPGSGAMSPAELDAAVAYIAARPAIREVILTGGDPLMMAPRRLGALLDRLHAIPHVELLRLHSRVPVVEPERITPALLRALERDKPVWLAIHANSAQEFGPEAFASIRALHGVGVSLVGQTVLLRGVNDDPAALEALFRSMLRCRIKPYYLHQLDPAPGTARFHVPIAEGRRLLEQLRGRVTGLAWPTYVLDIEGGFGKVPIGPDYLGADGVRDPWGSAHPLAGSSRAG